MTVAVISFSAKSQSGKAKCLLLALTLCVLKISRTHKAVDMTFATREAVLYWPIQLIVQNEEIEANGNVCKKMPNQRRKAHTKEKHDHTLPTAL